MNHMALSKKLKLNAGKKPMPTVRFDFLVKDVGFNTINGVANSVDISVDNFLDSSTELKLYEWRKMLEHPVDMFNSIIPLVLHLSIPSNDCLSHASKYHKVVDIVDEKTQEMVCCACVYSSERTEALGLYDECVFMMGGGSGG